MIGFLRWTAGTLALAAVVHFAVILAYPQIVMARLMQEIEGSAGGTNRAVYPPRPDHTSRRVVRPSPDLFYALCVYDISLGPVRVRAPVADNYWSVALFADNTDNFFVMSDAHEGADFAQLVLAEKGTDVTDVRYPVATPPTSRGIVLYRLLIGSEEELAVLYSLRRRMTCEPYPANAAAGAR